MLEYHSKGSTGLRYGGDTLNTAIHLARAGHEVAYVTAVGTDPISDALVASWAAEGIDTRFVLRHPTRNPGIYAIHLDEHGERSFLYWRDRSAAREMFALEGMAEALSAAMDASLLYFSLITLAVVGDEGRDRLLGLAARRREAGSPVAYDSNFRPALWNSLADAQDASRHAVETCSIGLPTNTDERELWDTSESDADIVRKWADNGRLIALKAADKGCLLMQGQRAEPDLLPATKIEVIDTSGAGDAFNAGFLSAYLLGECPLKCAESGQNLARRVIGQMGAIPS
ncbi:sugar kinase [Qipengyuania sp. 1NDH10]|nr:sugar kinase [Qipengyuania vesicularis]MBX7527730.1 sugar kinase [Qipengyuania vesicularis]